MTFDPDKPLPLRSSGDSAAEGAAPGQEAVTRGARIEAERVADAKDAAEAEARAGRLSSAEVDLVNEVVSHRLRQDDIKRILDRLGSSDRDHFTEKLADILRKTSALLEVSRRVSDSLSLDVLLPRMVDIVSEFIIAERATIFLNDPRTHEIYSRVASGTEINEIRFPNHLGIAGAVFKSGNAEVIPDAYADNRFNQAVDKKTGYRTRNILCAPIRTVKSEVIGVAQVLNKKSGDFVAEDMRLLESITAQAASAFLNAQLHEQIERSRLAEAQLLEVTTAISRELHLEPLLRKIMETVTRLLGADRSTLFLHDRRRNELWSRVAQGQNVNEIRFPSHLGIAGSVFTSGQTINIPDAYADNRFNKEVDKKTGYKTDTILCMPVFNKRNEAIGVIQVLNKQGGPFTGIDEQRLAMFSSQAAIALENAQLFEDVVNVKNYNESILRSMSNGVVTLDADENIVTANDAALRLFRYEKTPERILAKKVDEFFWGKNTWIAEAVDRVQRSRSVETSMDVDLWLRQEDGDEHDERRRERASVNVQVVPLGDTKGGPLGTMLVLEDITQEKRLKGTMARYMPKAVADKLLQEGEAVLGGTIQKTTVLFTDIRSFTSISERIGAQETVKMLNEYFSIMVDILLENGGILDKYIGDAIMAVFGAPFPGPKDADNAVRTGVGMLRALRAFNEKRWRDNQEPLLMGCGINTDEVLSGNIGSLKRMDYTVIGDGVNLASRLEGTNKYYATELLISEMTVRELTEPFMLREVDKIRVKGKNEPVSVYEVLDHHDEASFPNRDLVLKIFSNGLQFYRERKFDKAMASFGDALELHPSDGLSKIYLGRCETMLAHPPEEGWDGVWTMKDK